jgi:hypothetical protein
MPYGYDTPRRIKGKDLEYLSAQSLLVATGDIDPNTFISRMLELGLNWEEACMEMAGSRRYKEFCDWAFE